MITAFHPVNNLVNTFNAASACFNVTFGQADKLTTKDKNVLERLASDRNTPMALLERLATYPLADVRAAVSDNQNAPLNLIWALAKDRDADVRCQIAENHNLPLAVIRSLIDDENPYVASRAQKTYDRLRAS